MNKKQIEKIAHELDKLANAGDFEKIGMLFYENKEIFGMFIDLLIKKDTEMTNHVIDMNERIYVIAKKHNDLVDAVMRIRQLIDG